MKPRCWIGCVAQVVRALFPENVGKCGQIVGRQPVTGLWIVQFPTPIRWRAYVSEGEGWIDLWDDKGPVSDAHLIPLIPRPPALALPRDAETPQEA